MLSLFLSMIISSQVAAQSAAGPRPSFEVASIKPIGFDGRVTMAPQPNGLSAWGVTTRMLMRNAYRVQEFQIEGGPNWINEDRFSVEAKAPTVGPGQLPLMIQSMLEDRFKLKVHRETREMPVYTLTAGTNGHKLKSTKAPVDAPPEMRGFRVSPGQIEGAAVSLSQLVNVLSVLLGRTVIDQTGATGLFDVSLHWENDIGPPNSFGPAGPDIAPPVNSTGLTLSTALQDQLGLRIKSDKGPVEIIVIDSVEKPAEN